MHRFVREEAQRPFDLTSDLMLRASLLRLRDEEYIFVLTTHHIASDGWSMGIFFRELSVLYEAFSARKPSPLPELPIQYADFALWQRNWLQGDVLESQLGYWKKQLTGAPPLLELPADRVRPAVQSFRGASKSFKLPTTLTRAIQSLSRSERATPFIILLAAFQTLLHRHAGGDDIVVGTPIAGRNRFEIEGLIGFFINTLVLRTDLSGNPTFRELLGRVREMALEAYAHQDLPFERLVEELQPERNLSHNPLFQVMFVLQNTPRRAFSLPGLTLSELKVEHQTAKFDLSLSITETAGELTGVFEYNTDLFDPATIIRMRDHFRTLLEGIVADPDQRLSDLPLLTEAERRQLLVEWNDTQRDYPIGKCMHQLFEAQAERTPEAVALVFPSTGSGHGGDQQLTYRELNARANQLARYLVKLGVGPQVLVAICMERSVEMVIGILGVLKAGAAYVPLDPMLPRERLAFMLEDTHAPVLLTQSKLLSQLPNMTDDGRPTTDEKGPPTSFPQSEIRHSPCAMHRPAVICLDRDWEMMAEQTEANPTVETTPDNLAYVIYTSGSTGKPKGVMISHGAILNHTFWMQNRFQISETDRILQKTSFSFDASIWEFYAPFVAGARLVLAGPEGHQDSRELIQVIEEQKVTTLQVVPSLLRVLLDEPDLERCTHLRRVFAGGEPLPVELQERFFARTGAELYNLYGPTEASIDATFWTCKRNADRQIVPIGRPIANTDIYLLDRHLHPVPIGVAGEVHIGGAGLARGYLNRPDLTAERFIPNPFSDEPGARAYKTGDLARYLPDGNIEFLGRIDHQVKIRGFRIELGEVEAALARHPAVGETVVLAREDTPGEKRLVAYVVPNPDLSPSTSELRSVLKEKLPEYMVPSAFVLLQSLPLTPNGKVDRKALPAPDQSRPEQETPFVPPRSWEQKTIAEIWAQVLKVHQVGSQDNFFDLGGHSLLATQIVSRIREAFAVELPLRSLFEAPTVSGLASVIEQAKKNGAESPGPKISPVSRHLRRMTWP